MKELHINNYLKKIITLVLFVIKLNIVINDSSLLDKYLDIDYTHALSLLNGNIFILHKNGVIVYNYNFSIILYNNNFEGATIINSEEENSLTSIIQCENDNNQYIVALIKNTIHIFSARGEYLFSIENTSLFSDFSITNIIYIYYSFLYYKSEDSNYYFIITYKNNNNKIKIIEFIININTKLYSVHYETTYNVENIVSDSISCQIINSNAYSNILFCFYVKNVDNGNFFLLNLFDIENNFEMINETIIFKNFDNWNNHLIKTIRGNKQKERIIIDFMAPDSWTFRWFAFDFNSFQFSNIIYGGDCMSGTKLFTLNYINYIDNYVLTCKKEDYITLSFIKDNSNLQDIKLEDFAVISYYSCINYKNYKIIFLPYEEKYNLITNFLCTVFPLVITKKLLKF
jgi:hypothetical protein